VSYKIFISYSLSYHQQTAWGLHAQTSCFITNFVQTCLGLILDFFLLADYVIIAIFYCMLFLAAATHSSITELTWKFKFSSQHPQVRNHWFICYLQSSSCS